MSSNSSASDGYRHWEVIDAAHQAFWIPSLLSRPGLGGHCIPVDPFYLSWKAKEFDFRTKFIELAEKLTWACRTT